MQKKVKMISLVNALEDFWVVVSDEVNAICWLLLVDWLLIGFFCGWGWEIYPMEVWLPFLPPPPLHQSTRHLMVRHPRQPALAPRRSTSWPITDMGAKRCWHSLLLQFQCRKIWRTWRWFWVTGCSNRWLCNRKQTMSRCVVEILLLLTVSPHVCCSIVSLSELLFFFSHTFIQTISIAPLQVHHY